MSSITLETERLILRRFTMDDAESMFKNWASDSEVTRFMPYETCETLEQTRSRIEEWFAYLEKAGLSCVFAIILRNTHELIGTIDYAMTDSGAKSAEVGYQLGKRWWNAGYAAEALKAVIKHCFEDMGLHRIWAMYDPLNAGSGAVMRKAGMSYEGTLRKDGVRKGVLRDSARYAILAEDYFG
jgi:ribosomal-protein-alanine N-acetyltransferase